MQHFPKIKGTLQSSLVKYNFFTKNCHMKTWLACAASQNCRCVVDKEDSTCRVAAGEAEHTTHCMDCTLALTGTARTLLPGGYKPAASSHPCMQLLPKTDFKRLPLLHAPETALKLQISISCHLTAMHLSRSLLWRI